MENVSAIILAAGESKRMGKNKLSLPYKDKPLIQHTFNLVDKINFLERIVVISPKNAKELIHLSFPKDAKIIYNPHPEYGQSHSVALGTQAAKGEAYLFFTGDQPLLTAELIQEILSHGSKNRIVFPLKENGEPSNPTLFGENFRQDLCSVKGSCGGKEVRDKNSQHSHSFTPKNPKQLLDIDTTKDYEQLLLSQKNTLKNIDYIITFPQTHNMIKAEITLRKQNIPLRSMPLPPVLGDACGFCIRLKEKDLDKALEILKMSNIETSGAYEISVADGKPTYVKKENMKIELEKCFNLLGHQIISVIGSGGKTSLIKYLSKSYPHETILISTTTKILMPREGEYGTAVVAGDKVTTDSVEKLQMPKNPNFLKSFGNFDKVFLEADGSKGLPLKAWTDNEPVVLPETTITIAVIPITALGKAADETNIQRLPLWLNLCDSKKGTLISEEILVKMITKENGLLQKAKGKTILFFNQVENKEQLESTKKILELLPENNKKKISKIIAGSVAKGKGQIVFQQEVSFCS